jgi:hypothetical protein
MPDGDDASVSTSNTDMSQFISGLNGILTRYKGLIVGVFGIATLSLVGLFIYYFIKLGSSGDNPERRKDAIKDILKCGIATAVMGSITLMFSLAYYTFA